MRTHMSPNDGVSGQKTSADSGEAAYILIHNALTWSKKNRDRPVALTEENLIPLIPKKRPDQNLLTSPQEETQRNTISQMEIHGVTHKSLAIPDENPAKIVRSKSSLAYSPSKKSSKSNNSKPNSNEFIFDFSEDYEYSGANSPVRKWSVVEKDIVNDISLTQQGHAIDDQKMFGHKVVILPKVGFNFKRNQEKRKKRQFVSENFFNQDPELTTQQKLFEIEVSTEASETSRKLDDLISFRKPKVWKGGPTTPFLTEVADDNEINLFQNPPRMQSALFTPEHQNSFIFYDESEECYKIQNNNAKPAPTNIIKQRNRTSKKEEELSKVFPEGLENVVLDKELDAAQTKVDKLPNIFKKAQPNNNNKTPEKNTTKQTPTKQGSSTKKNQNSNSGSDSKMKGKKKKHKNEQKKKGEVSEAAKQEKIVSGKEQISANMENPKTKFNFENQEQPLNSRKKTKAEFLKNLESDEDPQPSSPAGTNPNSVFIAPWDGQIASV